MSIKSVLNFMHGNIWKKKIAYNKAVVARDAYVGACSYNGPDGQRAYKGQLWCFEHDTMSSCHSYQVARGHKCKWELHSDRSKTFEKYAAADLRVQKVRCADNRDEEEYKAALRYRKELLESLKAEDPEFKELQELVETRFAAKPQHSVGVVYDVKQLKAFGECRCACCAMVKADEDSKLANIVAFQEEDIAKLRSRNEELEARHKESMAKMARMVKRLDDMEKALASGNKKRSNNKLAHMLGDSKKLRKFMRKEED